MRPRLKRRTVDKMLAFPTPPGYRRKKASPQPRIDPFVGIMGLSENSFLGLFQKPNTLILNTIIFQKRAVFALTDRPLFVRVLTHTGHHVTAVLEAHIHWLHTITFRQTGKLKQSSLLEMTF